MKKLIVVILVFLFSFIFYSFSYAKDSATPSATQNIEYDLPYPGLLPDNPLYYLKAIRDNVFKFLIRDPLTKAEFDLLQSDKRLEAARLLLLKGNSELSITTLSKSGNYFDDAITNILKVKEKGDSKNSLLGKMITSSKKHQQIIREMQKGKKTDLLLNLRFLEARARDFQERLEIINSQ